MVDKKKGIWKAVVNKTNDLEGAMTQMWVGIKWILGTQLAEADTEITTVRAHSCKKVSSSKRGSTSIIEHYRKLGTPSANETFGEAFEKEINAWEEVNVDASEREDGGSEGIQGEFTRE